MAKKASLTYVETEGGPFILLPVELKKSWSGVGDEDEGVAGDYERTAVFGTSVGVLAVGGGQALILGSPEVTAFLATGDGGVFIQRFSGEDDTAVIAAVEKAVAETKGWKKTSLTFDAGKGKLALFDSAYAYADAEADERLKVSLAPGKYSVETRGVKAPDDIEVELVRLRR